MTEDLTLAVKKGAHLLDEKYPEWHQSIDLDTLNLQRADLCVLGQLGRAHYGSFDSEVDALGVDAKEYGFDLAMDYPNQPLDDWYKDRDGRWSTLTELWVNEIRLRQLLPGSSPVPD